MGIPRTQYHATHWENVDFIREQGLILPRIKDVDTYRFEIPSISTADHPKFACAYHPSGALVTLKLVKRGVRYINRTWRNVRTDENLEDAVNRWLREAYKKGAAGVYVGVGLQSTVGNQTIDPTALEVVGIHECH